MKRKCPEEALPRGKGTEPKELEELRREGRSKEEEPKELEI
jgi:hypothetical protein